MYTLLFAYIYFLTSLEDIFMLLGVAFKEYHSVFDISFYSILHFFCGGNLLPSSKDKRNITPDVYIFIKKLND